MILLVKAVQYWEALTRVDRELLLLVQVSGFRQATDFSEQFFPTRKIKKVEKGILFRTRGDHFKNVSNRPVTKMKIYRYDPFI